MIQKKISYEKAESPAWSFIFLWNGANLYLMLGDVRVKPGLIYGL